MILPRLRHLTSHRTSWWDIYGPLRKFERKVEHVWFKSKNMVRVICRAVIVLLAAPVVRSGTRFHELEILMPFTECTLLLLEYNICYNSVFIQAAFVDCTVVFVVPPSLSLFVLLALCIVLSNLPFSSLGLFLFSFFVLQHGLGDTVFYFTVYCVYG